MDNDDIALLRAGLILTEKASRTLDEKKRAALYEASTLVLDISLEGLLPTITPKDERTARMLKVLGL